MTIQRLNHWAIGVCLSWHGASVIFGPYVVTLWGSGTKEGA